jgi:DNA-binding NarL/FixJ family response regulator
VNHRQPASNRATRRQVEILRAYIDTGSIKAAAHEVGLAETTCRQHLSALSHRTGCANVAQAACLLGAGGLRPAARR